MSGNCEICKHRPYGEQRRYTDCMIIEPFWSKQKPKPFGLGINCKRFEDACVPPAETHSGFQSNRPNNSTERA